MRLNNYNKKKNWIFPYPIGDEISETGENDNLQILFALYKRNFIIFVDFSSIFRL